MTNMVKSQCRISQAMEVGGCGVPHMMIRHQSMNQKDETWRIVGMIGVGRGGSRDFE
jgi:hypothetical protein